MTISERRHWVHILYLKRGLRSPVVAEVLGVHRRTIMEDVRWWRRFYREVA